MRIETLRIVGDWLARDDYGVNAYLTQVPRDAGDPVPPQIASWQGEQLAVFDATRHVWVAERQDAPAVPSLYVIGEDVISLTGEASPDGQVRRTVTPIIVTVRYLTARSDTVAALRDGEYTLRAVVRSLKELFLNANDAARIRNGACLTAMVDPVTYAPVVESIGNHRVAGGVVLNLDGRDADPSF